MNPKLLKVKKLQHKMREANIDIVLVPLGINFKWLYNIKEEPSERLLISIIESENSPKFLVPAFEAFYRVYAFLPFSFSSAEIRLS